MIKIKVTVSNKNINIIGSSNNEIILFISSNQIKSKDINILNKLLIERLSELGINKILVIKKDIKHIFKNNENSKFIKIS